MVSKSCKYAIRASVFIASFAGSTKKPGVQEIAAEIEAPPAFTGKILQILNKNKIVTSIKGPYGGFICDERQRNLAVSEIVNAVDGLEVFQDCVMGLQKCSDDHPCPMHYKIIQERDKMFKIFRETKIKDLAKDLSEGKVFLKNS